MKEIRRYIQNARDPEIVMLLLGIAQAIGISSALILADGSAANIITQFLSLLRGSFMGTALSFGLMYVSHEAPRMPAKKAQRLAYVALVGLMIVSPVIIAPAVQAGIPSAILSNVVARWAWAIAIASAPDLVALAVAVASKAPAKDIAEVSEPKPAKVATPATPPAPKFVCVECQRECKSQNSLNAHMIAHKAKP